MFLKYKLPEKLCLVMTSLFGVGYIPYFPGTASCLLALLFFYLIKSKLTFFLFTLGVGIISFSLSSYAEDIYQEKDSKKIVIDDFLGMLISLLFIPRKLPFVISAFLLFRFFDMLKVPPANKLEKLKGSKGVVGDDLIAAVYTNLVLLILKLFLPS